MWRLHIPHSCAGLTLNRFVAGNILGLTGFHGHMVTICACFFESINKQIIFIIRMEFVGKNMNKKKKRIITKMWRNAQMNVLRGAFSPVRWVKFNEENWKQPSYQAKVAWCLWQPVFHPPLNFFQSVSFSRFFFPLFFMYKFFVFNTVLTHKLNRPTRGKITDFFFYWVHRFTEKTKRPI